MNSKICIYASEIAALIGQNRWVTSDEAFQKVLSRISANPKKVIIKMQNSDDPKLRKTAVAIQENAAKEVECREIVEELSTHVDVVESLPQTASRVEICKARDLAIESLPTPTCERETRALKVVTGKIHCAAGQRTEAIVVVEKKIENNQKAYFKDVAFKNRGIRYEYVIFGRTDGVNDETLVEIKNRKKLWKKAFDQERTQINTYLFLTDLTRCRFIETCSASTYEEVISFDANKLKDDIHKLNRVVYKLHKVL